VTDWFSLFAVYRVLVIRNDEVIQGVLRPDLRPGSPDLEAGLRSWRGRHYLQSGPAGVELTLVRPIAGPETERWWLHLLLGLLTLATTTLAGAYLQGHEPLRLAAAGIGPLVLPLPVALDPSAAAPGLFFSIPLLVVLLGHELGHYFAARRHGMDVSPPYFIPAPHWLNLIGTFGAFIRLRSVTMNRGVLMDVGAAGPLVSFVLSLPLAVAGLAMSRELRWRARDRRGSIWCCSGASRSGSGARFPSICSRCSRPRAAGRSCSTRSPSRGGWASS
jgi:Zn-dependent protease